MKRILFLVFLYSFCPNIIVAQRANVITEESQVPEYQLPDVLTRFQGGKVKSEKVWFKKQRPEILKLFTNEVFGKVPGDLKISDVKVWENSIDAFNGLARRKQLSLFFKKNDRTLEVNVLMYLPVTEQKVPVFLAYNFSGNHTIAKDPNVRLTESWVYDNPSVGIINNQVTEQSRATASDSCPVLEIVKQDMVW